MGTDYSRELVERSLAGDRAAFEQLIAPLVEPGYRLACGMLLDRAEAENASRRRRSRPGSNSAASGTAPTPAGIPHDRCKPLPRCAAASLVGSPPGSRRGKRGSAPRPLTRPAAWTCGVLGRLAATDRALMVLHHYLDLPLEEVARVLRVSPAAAKSRLYRVLRRLRSHLEPSEARV